MNTPRALPRIQIWRDGKRVGQFFWDSRLNEIRKVNNPHVRESVDEDLAAIFNRLQVGGSHWHGGGLLQLPCFEYRRIS